MRSEAALPEASDFMREPFTLRVGMLEMAARSFPKLFCGRCNIWVSLGGGLCRVRYKYEACLHMNFRAW